MIFATDLDNTMIFSRRVVGENAEGLCAVEYHKGKTITFMTPSAIEKLKELMKKIHVIPTTTRSISQFMRVQNFSSAQYAIVDNGGSILQNGSIEPYWDKYIRSVLLSYDLERVLKLFCNLPKLISVPRIVDGKFVFAKSEDVCTCSKILLSEIDTKIWNLSFQGNKIYAIPKGITKGNALRFVKENLIAGNHYVVASGDSNLDLSMLEYADCSIIPKDSSLFTLKPNFFIELGNGINTADEILDFVAKLPFQ